MLVNLEHLDETERNVVRYVDETVIALIDIESDEGYEQVAKAIFSHVSYLRAKYGKEQVEDCVLFHVVVRSTTKKRLSRFDFDGSDSFLSLVEGLKQQFIPRKEE